MYNSESKNKKMTRRELLKMASPLGRVILETHNCTACGLCAVECDTRALSFAYVENSGTCRLLFRHRLCTACGKCADVCPEKCLRVERTVDIERINASDEILFEDEVVRCAECGKPFATRSMVDSMKAKLGIEGQPAGSYLEICPDCKAGVRLSGAGK
jgi:ferredoxin